MKTRWLPTNIKCFALLVASLFVVSSCDDEDEFTPLLISITVPDGAFDGSVVYIVASDASGEVITFDQLEEGETTELISESYKENTFTLSIVDTYEYGSYKDLYGMSYAEVSRGINLEIPEYTDEENYIGLTVSNFQEDASYYLISSNGDYGSAYPEYASEGLYISKSPTRLFVTKYDANYQAAGFAFPSTTYSSNQTANVNLTANYTAFTTESVTFSESAYYGVSVYGRLSASDYSELYRVSSSSTSGTQLTVRYPGSTFPAYSSESYIEDENYYFEAYNKSQRSDFTTFDADVDLDLSNQSIEYSITTAGTIVGFDFYMNESNENEYFDWDIYAPVGSNKTVVIPDLPAEITEDFSAYTYNGWRSEEEVEIMSVEGINSLNSYLAAEVDGSLYGGRNMKYLYLYLGSGAAREARLNLANEKKRTTKLFNAKSRFNKPQTQGQK